MARDSTHEFVNASDSDALVSELVAAYEKITNTIVRPSSPERIFIQWVAYILLLERAKINQVGNSNVPSYATGEDLDALGRDIYGVERPTATPATVTMRFTISEAQNFSVLIPKGTRVTDESQIVYFATDDDKYIPAGSVSIDVPCTCQTAGVIGNEFVEGQIASLVDVFEYHDSCKNITESSGGSDAPTDDEYYELLKESTDSWSTAGPRGGYAYFAKKVSTEIGDVLAKQPAPGSVAIYVLMRDGMIAPSEVKQAVLKACSDENVRPLTDHVTVEDLKTVAYNVKIRYYTVYGSSKSASKMRTDVEQAVKDYVSWQQARIGRDINPDKLRDYVLSAGVKRLEVTEPTFTKLIDGSGEDATVPQVGKIGTITIDDGGYEDE
jgi:phage-related baseplate assembly protein